MDIERRKDVFMLEAGAHARVLDFFKGFDELNFGVADAQVVVEKVAESVETDVGVLVDCDTERGSFAAQEVSRVVGAPAKEANAKRGSGDDALHKNL